MNGIKNIKFAALDSNIFIYYFEDNPQFAPLAEVLFQRLNQGKLKAVTSIISTVEALSYPSPPEVIKGITEGFLNLPNLEIIEVDQKIGFEAARLRRTYGFRLPDSIQLATAKLNKAQVFITKDQELKKFKELKVILLSELQ